MASEAVVITPEVLEEKIKSTVPGCTYVKAVDQSDGCGAKFEVTVLTLFDQIYRAFDCVAKPYILISRLYLESSWGKQLLPSIGWFTRPLRRSESIFTPSP
jgi:hypothetical protein